MKRCSILLIFVLGILGGGRAHAQFIVSDPMTLAKMVQKFIAEAAQWTKQLDHWGKLKQSWSDELKQFEWMRQQWEKENKLFEKLLGCAETDNRIWLQFLAGVGEGYQWEELRLKEIMDILNSLGFFDSSGQDPYQGLFTLGKKIEEVFPQIRDWSVIKKSDKYLSNPEYKNYVDRLIEEQKRMLDDLENKIKVIAKLNKLVPERENKFNEIQKRLEACVIDTPVNLTKLWVLESEVGLELCREMFHLVALNRIETENFLLDELRTLNEKKHDEQFDEKTKEKDKQVVLQVLTNSKGGGK